MLIIIVIDHVIKSRVSGFGNGLEKWVEHSGLNAFICQIFANFVNLSKWTLKNEEKPDQRNGEKIKKILVQLGNGQGMHTINQIMALLKTERFMGKMTPSLLIMAPWVERR